MNTSSALVDSMAMQRAKEHKQRILRHSQFVTRIKWVVTSFIGVSIMALILWPIVFKDEMRINVAFSEVEQVDTTEKPSMLNPRFHGVDEAEQPFNVIASRAIHQGGEQYVLEDVSGDIVTNKDGWFYIAANYGDLNMTDKSINLNGSVNIFSDKGFEVFTDAAFVDFQDSLATSDAKVMMQGPLGTMDAQGFIIRDKGNTMLFYGGVTTTLYLNETKS